LGVSGVVEREVWEGNVLFPECDCLHDDMLADLKIGGSKEVYVVS
jgi:hypothetical protein